MIQLGMFLKFDHFNHEQEKCKKELCIVKHFEC